ncbi:MAG: TOBE domain-containing protein [Mollicutes bacterium]|nr:TOBE domain-containing protein [Mollicutes bacterium]
MGSPERNFLPIKIKKEGDTSFIALNGNYIDVTSTLNKDHQLDALDGKETELGIRPESIGLVTSANIDSLDQSCIFKVHIKIAEYLGSELYLYFDFAGKQAIARIPSKYFVKTGDDIKLYFDPKKSYVFDPATSNTISFPEPSEEVRLDV